MATGTVKWFNDDKGYGFIRRKTEARTFLFTTARSPGKASRASLRARRLSTKLSKDRKVHRRRAAAPSLRLERKLGRAGTSRWTIASGTKAYKGLDGKGTETENASYTVSTLTDLR